MESADWHRLGSHCLEMGVESDPAKHKARVAWGMDTGLPKHNKGH
jgi:hypothetical protein